MIDPKYYLSVRSLVLWSYTTLGDPRWVFTNKYIVLHQNPKATKPQKLGLSNRRHWGAYLRNGHLFVKQNTYQEGATYPDGGCSFETFTNAAMLELECLGPLTKLPANGGTTTLNETWWLLDGVKSDSTDASIDAEVLPKIRWLSKMFL